MTTDVLRELEGMRALARALARGDADDLLQDAAIDVLGHPPPQGEPSRPWLATVVRNRWRMTRRSATRRTARDAAVETVEAETPDAALDRARAFERLAAALVALDEPFRATVIARYLDGQSAAEIARTMNVPAGTVRWRLKTGLDRLRAALDDTQPRWRRAFAPLAGAGLMKAKTASLVVVVLALLLGSAAVLFFLPRDAAKPPGPPAVATATRQPSAKPLGKRTIDETVEAALPPGQGKPILDAVTGPGLVSGRVINWSTGDGVEGADITFSNAAGATTVRSRANGVFELAPPEPGRFVLTTISAAGFLPYAPELLHSNVVVEVVRDRAVRGITVFLFPAVDYTGLVVDDKGKPVAGAKVRLLGTPAGEQLIDKLDTEWTSDKDGRFTFHAADDAVLEAARGNQRGYAVLDGDVAITRLLKIQIGANVPSRDRTITGKVVANGAPVANVLVRARPLDDGLSAVRSFAFATTGSDGTFTLEDVDEQGYALATQAEGYAAAFLEPVVGGARDVVLALDAGQPIAGRVVNSSGDAVPAYTLLVFERRGALRGLVQAKSIVDPEGRFELRVAAGEYDLQASASGWAPSPFTSASAGARGVELRVSEGATLRGKIIAADGSGPVEYARVMREARGGGASAQPANAGTVTRADGSFELSGIPPGPVAITIGAGGYHPKIEAGLTASDGAKLGPITIPLVPLKPGEQPTLELVGIGVQLAGGPTGLTVQAVFPNSGAEAAGITGGEEIVAIDGVAATQLGIDGAVAKIRGVEGTTVSVTVLRAGKPVTLVVTRKKLRA